jgi:cellulose biosynthesis protein BcsQ
MLSQPNRGTRKTQEERGVDDFPCITPDRLPKYPEIPPPRSPVMIDLFHFLKDLFQNPAEVIASFFMGVIAAATFLSYVIYWFLSSFYSKKIAELDASVKKAKDELADNERMVKDAERERDELKKKSKDRKGRIEEQEKEISKLKETASNEAAATRKYHELAAKYNKLGSVAMSLKKQATSLNDQAKVIEKMQAQSWELSVDEASLPRFRALGKNKAVIIAVINLKGGVGKTTLTANIAITYCHQMNKRVLAIDLDFQASLTNLCLPADRFAELQLGAGRLVDNVFKDWSADVANRTFSNISQTREPKLHLLANSERLAKVEDDAKARWIMNQGADLRGVLRSALHDPIFQDNFDVILIDCPPRWTTGSINAIACCDYVLIPTVLDRVSSEAVPRLLGWLRDLRRASPELYGHFEILGVLGNLAFPREKLIAQEQDIWEGLPAKCKATWLAPVYSFDTIIRDKAEFRRAANSRDFAALHPVLQPAFRKLIDEIEARRAVHEGR